MNGRDDQQPLGSFILALSVRYLVDTRIKNLCHLLAIYLGNLTSHQSERDMPVLTH